MAGPALRRHNGGTGIVEALLMFVKDKQLWCKGCGGHIVAATPRWSAHEPGEYWHFACAEKSGLTRLTHSLLGLPVRRSATG